MVALITAIISVVISRILFQGYQAFITSASVFQADWQGWAGVQRMAEDIHRIRSRTAITAASSSQLAFTDVDGNTIQYQLNGSSLLRNGQVLSSGIQSLSFGYLDQNGASTGTTSSIRYISLAVIASSGNIPVSFSTLVGTRGV